MLNIMEKSYKNWLQEHFQKNGLALPKYQTEKINGLDHDPIWQSKLELNGHIYIGDGSTKKEAESVVAGKAFINYKKIIIPDVKVERKQKKELMEIDFNQYSTVLLVDGENCDIDMIKLINSNVIVLIFAAKNTTKNKIFEYQTSYNNCYVFLSQCVGKDAADHLLTFYAGKLSMMPIITNKKIFVITKDHYGEFLERFMLNCKFICDLDEID